MVVRRAFLALLLLSVATFPATRTRVREPKAKPSPRTTAKPAIVSGSERQWVQRWMRGMSLRDEIAQLIMVSSFGEMPSTRTQAYRDFVHQVRDLRVGGITVVNRVVNGSVRNAEPYAMATFLNRMQKLAKIPLLVSADFERGASMRVSNTTRYPHLMAYGAAGDVSLTRALGLATAHEARTLGVQWIFAPDADVNNNPDNPIINIRSFGENPPDVAKQVVAFIEGAHSDPKAPVLATAKHFPGHGDTNVDSHMGLASLPADRARMNQVELVPFKAAIAAGVDSVMTAHMAVPAIEPQEIPATVSTKVLTGLLRDDLAFNGLIVTDAMDMQGLVKQFPGGEAAVRALEAGADVLLMPSHPDEVLRAVMAAVKDGRLTRKRIQQSTTRVLAAKARVGLQKRKLVDLDDVADGIDPNESEEQAQTAAERAITLVKNDKSSVPLSSSSSACVYILTESRYSQQGRKMLEELQKRNRGGKTVLLDPTMPQPELDEFLQKAGSCEQNVVAAFVTVGAYRGNVALAGNFTAFVNSLIAEKPPVTMISLGNPYLLRSFPNVASYMATFSTVPVSETAAVKALFGESPITGHLPVSIPGIAKYGDGIQVRNK